MVGVAAAVLIAVGPQAEPPTAVVPHADGLRAKGDGAHLLVRQVVAPGRGAPVVSGDTLVEGDRLQLSVRVAEPTFAAVLSVDGRGVVTLHHPLDGAEAVRLHAGEEPLTLTVNVSPFWLRSPPSSAEKGLKPKSECEAANPPRAEKLPSSWVTFIVKATVLETPRIFRSPVTFTLPEVPSHEVAV